MREGFGEDYDASSSRGDIPNVGRLIAYKELSRRIIFPFEADGVIVYGFMHGNWALDNSLPNGQCTVNNELDILRKTGCWSD